MPPLKAIVSYLDDLFDIHHVKDHSLNGLQVECAQDIRKIAVAVDASEEAIRAATQQGAQLLIVHHGLFWGKDIPVTGSLYRRIKACIEGDLALYACHLPLDLHPDLGNNARLLRLLNLEPEGDFGQYEGSSIGKYARFPKIAFSQLVTKVNKALGTRSVVASYGKTTVSSVGVVSGLGGYALEEAKSLGLDVLLTGETSHQVIPVARELQMNVIFAGHYATETLGVKALAEAVEKKFKLPTVFVDFPTGL